MTEQGQNRLTEMLARTRQAREVVHRILEGQKLLFDPGQPDGRAFIQFIENMGAANSCDTAAFFYYLTPEKQNGPRLNDVMDADTSVHLPDVEFLREAMDIREGLAAEGLANVDVFGGEIARRQREADNFILSGQGDFVAVGQFLDLLTQQLEALDRDDLENPVLQKSVTVDTGTGKYASLLDFIGLDRDTVKDLSARFNNGHKRWRISLTDENWSMARAVEALGTETGKTPPPLPALMKSGAHLFLATTNQEKVHDLSGIIRRKKYPMLFDHVYKATGHYADASEFRGTYSGNCADKTDETGKAVHGRAETVASNLSQTGVDQSEGWYVCADGGASFRNAAIADDPVFAPACDVIVPESGFFGPETKIVTQRMGGAEKLGNATAEVFSRLGPGADRAMVDECAMMFGAFDGHVKPFGVRARSPLLFADTPDPQDDPVFTSRHRQIDPQTGRTLARLKREGHPYLQEGTAIARCFNMAMKHCGIPENTMRPSFTNAADPHEIRRARDFRSSGDLLRDVREFVEKGDIYVMDAPARPDESKADIYLRRWLIPTALFVGRQLHSVPGQVIIRDDPEYFPFFNMVNNASREGMCENPWDLVKNVGTDEALERMIASAARAPKPRRPAVPDYPEQFLPEPDRDVVSLFLSATNAEDRYLDDASIVTQTLLLNGIGIITGGGGQGMMGASSWAALDLAARGRDVYVGGVQEYCANEKERGPKDAYDAVLGPGRFTVMRDRFTRIAHIIELDRLKREYAETGVAPKKIFVALGGGPGSVEEILVPLILKLQGEPSLQNASFVVHNRGCYDNFLRSMNGDLANFGIHEVTGEREDVLRKVGELLGRPIQLYPGLVRTGGLYPFEEKKNPLLSGLFRGGAGGASHPPPPAL